MNKIFLIAIGFFSLCSCQQPDTSKPVNKKPNIVLIVSDDHGSDALGCYGNTVIKTPNLDLLAQGATKFTNAFCTSASCSASRSTILTGMYNHSIGHYGHAHEYHHFSTFDTIQSLPVLLEQHNYRTARIGKYHLAPEKVYHFQNVIAADPRNTVEMASKSVDFINDESEDPFFLYFCTDDPHRGHPFKPDPWNAPNTFGNLEGGYEGVQQVVYKPEDVLVPNFLPDTKVCREELAEYYQSVSRIDQGVGRLIAELKKAGKYENTIIVYISDNGIAFPGAKTTVYEPGIKLPCIIKSPNQLNKGTISNQLISWVDLTPTLLDYAGISYKENSFHGKSFYGFEQEDKEPLKEEKIYASHTFHEITMYYPMRVVRESKYKLIWNIAYGLPYPFASDLWISSTYQDAHINDAKFFGKRTVDSYLHRPEFELYDLDNDPDEIHNLANDSDYQHILERMKIDMKNFQRNTRDPWYTKWDHEEIWGGSGENL